MPSPRCVGPECRGAGRAGTALLGIRGDLDAGSRGSFTQAGRLIGVTGFDGVELGKGLAAIDELAQNREIDRFYAGAAKKAFLMQIGEEGERAAPFEEPSAIGRLLAPGALRRQFRGKTGEDVGPSVREGCGCKPREPDARDPMSGWFIYYVSGGVLLTPTKKCIGGGGRPPSWWERPFRFVSEFLKPPAPPVEPSPFKLVSPTAPVEPATPINPPAPPGGYLCMDPRIWPAMFRPQPTPCEAPKIPWPG